MKKLANTLILLLALAAPAAALDWEFLQSENIILISEVHASAVATPVAFPANAVYRKWDRVKAQQATRELVSEIQPDQQRPLLTGPQPTRHRTILGRKFLLLSNGVVAQQ